MYDEIVLKAVGKNSILQCGLKKARNEPDSKWNFITDMVCIQFGNDIKGSILNKNEKEILSNKLKETFLYLVRKDFQ